MLMRTAVNLRAAVNNLKHNIKRTELVSRDNSSPVCSLSAFNCDFTET